MDFHYGKSQRGDGDDRSYQDYYPFTIRKYFFIFHFILLKIYFYFSKIYIAKSLKLEGLFVSAYPIK